jgi:hypothetical protein
MMSVNLRDLILQGEHSELRVQWGCMTHIHRDRRRRPDIGALELAENMKRRRKLPNPLRAAYPGELWVATGFFIINKNEITRWRGPSAMKFGFEGVVFHVVSLQPWTHADGGPIFPSSEPCEAWNFRALCKPTPKQIAILTAGQESYPAPVQEGELVSFG